MNSCKLIITCMSGAWGGLEMAASELAVEFQNNGFEVLFICQTDSPVSEQVRQQGIACETVDAEASLVRKIMWFRGVINRFKPETILVNRLPSLKVIVPALIGSSDVNLVALSHMLVNYRKKDLVHRLLYARLNRLVVLTAHQRENHLNFLPVEEPKVVIIPDWINCKAHEPMSRHEIRNLYPESLRELPLSLIASRLDPQKGQDLAIQALGHALRKQRPFLLAVLGENTRGQRDVLRELKDLVQSEGVGDYVRFLGYRDNIFPFLGAADNVLVPSKEETFGRVIIEAMSNGTPVIASNRGGPTCIIRHLHSGILFEAESAEDLERQIDNLNSDCALRELLARNAADEAKKYSKTIIFQKLTQVIVPPNQSLGARELSFLDN